ncbi:hypothetical protein ABPG75_003417 [Micractinium tetrahymenae]
MQYHDQDALNLLATSPLAAALPGTIQQSAGGAGASSQGAARGWLELPLHWNAQGIGSYAGFRLREEPGQPALFGSSAELQQYEEQPAVVHFTGTLPPIVRSSEYLNPWVPCSCKPWAYLCRHPFLPAFFAALDETPWRGWRPRQTQVAEACAAEIGQLLALVAAEKPGFNAAEAKRQLLHLLQG